MTRRSKRQLRQEAEKYFKVALRDGGLGQMRQVLEPGSKPDGLIFVREWWHRRALLAEFDKLLRERRITLEGPEPIETRSYMPSTLGSIARTYSVAL